MPPSPTSGIVNQQMSASTSINRLTPNHLAYSSSDSNQSPPSGSKTKVEVAVQTDMSLDVEKMDENRNEKYIEEISRLTRMSNDVKTQLELEKARVKASKETIRRLMVQQSTMERKQVFLFFCKHI